MATGASVMNPGIINPGINACAKPVAIGGIVGVGRWIRLVALKAAAFNFPISYSGDSGDKDG